MNTCTHKSLCAIGTMTKGATQERCGVLACNLCGKNFFQKFGDIKDFVYQTIGQPDSEFPIVKFQRIKL